MTSTPENGDAKPRIPGREPLGPPLAKRFYKEVTVETRPEGEVVLLDGRAIRTPAKRLVVLPTRALADTVAAEWAAQVGSIDPARMPVTRIVNSALDGVRDAEALVAADIAAFAGSDLVCYRAVEPAGLVERQAAAWDPIVAWAASDLDARFRVVPGIMPVKQPEASIAAVARAAEGYDAFGLAGLHVVTTLTGSALIALALARGWLSPEAAWAAAHVDEDWQIEHWGQDAEAAARRERRRAEFDAASLVIEAATAAT